MAFARNLLSEASLAPASEYNRGYIDALEEVVDYGDELAWDEGEDVEEA
jgi:hypothetical protein